MLNKLQSLFKLLAIDDNPLSAAFCNASPQYSLIVSLSNVGKALNIFFSFNSPSERSPTGLYLAIMEATSWECPPSTLFQDTFRA